MDGAGSCTILQQTPTQGALPVLSVYSAYAADSYTEVADSALYDREN